MQSSLAPQVQAHVGGDVSGQIAVGSHIIQIGSVHGGVVNVAAPGEQPRPRPRPSPVLLRPRPFSTMLDRAGETETATRALALARSVELHGEDGIGKTSLLRRLAHHECTAAFPDGVVHLSARGQPAGDLCRLLWDAFHECDAPYVPTPATLRHDLQGRRALVMLDDVALERGDLETVLDAAPGCTFVWAGAARRGSSEVLPLRLGGLPAEDSLRLLERELGRALAPDEAPVAGALCDALDGHPLRLQQAASAVRDGALTLVEAAARAGGSRDHDPAVYVPPAGDRRRVLAAVAAFGGAPVRARHVAALTGAATAEDELIALARGNLLRGGEEGFAVPRSLSAALAAEAAAWREPALAHFAAWAAEHRAHPRAVLADADAMLALLEWAAAERRWDGVLRLGRAVEGPLALAGRLDAWERVLALVETAARQTEDRAAAAFALHQRGTRAACIAVPGADVLLREALGLRRGLGDHAGAAVTQHNLELFFPPAAGGDDGGQAREPSGDGGAGAQAGTAKLAAAAVGAVAVVGVVLAVVLAGGSREDRNPPPPPASAAMRNPPAQAPPVAAAPVPAPVSVAPPPPQPLPDGALVFGRQAVGRSSRARDYELANAWTVPMTVAAVADDSAGDFRVRSQSCAAGPLAPGARCVLSVAFAPTAAGERRGVLRLLDAGGSVVQRVSLSGTGEAPRRAAPRRTLPRVVPADLEAVAPAAAPAVVQGSAPAAGESTPAGITDPRLPITYLVRNDSRDPATVRQVRIRGRDRGDFRVVDDSRCAGALLHSGEQCEVSIAFARQGPGERRARLDVLTSPHWGQWSIDVVVPAP